MADTHSNNSFLIETTEQKPTKETEDMHTDFSDLTAQDEDNLLSKDANDLEDDIPSAQVQRQKPRTSDNMQQNSLKWNLVPRATKKTPPGGQVCQN